MRTQSISTLAGLSATTASLAVVLTGCGGGSRPPVSGGVASSASSSAVVVQAGAGARLSAVVSGSDLWNWEPSNEYPSDLVEVSGAPYSSGTATTPTTKYKIASQSCDSLLSSAGGPGYGELAYVYDEGANSAQTEIYAYAAYAFATADQATAYVQGLAAKFVSCGTFTETVNGTALKVAMALGDRSEAAAIPAANAAVDLRETVQVSGKTVTGDLLVAADGNIIVIEERSGNNGSLPTEVSLPKVAQDTFTAFAQGEASGPGSSGSGGPSVAPDSGVSPGANYGTRVGGGSR